MTARTSTALRAAAAWNLLGAGSALLAPSLHYRLLYIPPASHDPVGRVAHYTLWSIVLVMGISYGIAASDLQARRGILIAGAMGKTIACLIWVVSFAMGIGTGLLLVGGLGDLAWALYFITVIRRTS
jgi:hypothetical protein